MQFGHLVLQLGTFVATAAAVGDGRRQDTLEASAKGPIVDLGYAKYQGGRPGTGVDEFLGVRYAKPPIGNRRFRAPEDPSSELEMQDATKYRPNCLGVAESTGTPEVPGPDFAEDCLFVNVFKPSNATARSKLPVWVWITGGGFANAAWVNFNETNLVKESDNGIVFVEFSYRVGALGFLASEQVRKDGDLNVGLLDQRKLLHWVQSYIHKFGGDPSRVVIHGASAGATSVAYHLTAYEGRKDNELFAGVMVQDSFWPPQRTVGEMEPQYVQLLSRTNCTTLDCLRSVDIAKLQTASQSLPFPDGDKDQPAPPLFYWLPVIDGGLVPDRFYNLFEKGSFIRVPALIGDDTDEGTQYAPNATSASDVAVFMKNNYPNLSPQQLDEINELYPMMDPLPQNGAYFPTASAVYGDMCFICPGNEIASALARYSNASMVWNYRYNVRDPDLVAQGLGTHHDQEWFAVFGPEKFQDYEAKSDNTTNAAEVPIVRHYWISFVRGLNPNTHRVPQAPEWQPWGSGTGQRIRLETNKTAMEPLPREQLDKCSFWRRRSASTEQ
ncbi:uncharacterized protein LMH87_008408 [Akanthomyces muscarius]|uniref:Carboxylic ester hydrolase n=1 Tax=Akanthomyces muscarius TaxID=2231603 RepID=A0A9W8UQZ6_AKAMU|nr:uncharacterized protein LMH87_008408 [Akanthomyces muscarius]KAJ4159510.1 hypothetical protein LMH87_008408 [Akanthomyces muscarius]